MTQPVISEDAILQFLYQFPVAVWRMQADGLIDLMNPRAVTLLTELRLSVGSQGGWSILKALDADLANRLLDKLSSPGLVAEQFPIERLDVNGSQRYLGLTLEVISHDVCLFTLEDVTRWRQAELAQINIDRRYRYLLENVPAGVVIHGPNSEILTANAEASRVLGLSLEQLMGRVAIDPVWHFIADDGTVLPLTLFPVNQVMASRKRLKQFVLGVQRPAKLPVVWLVCNAYPMQDVDGKLTEVIVSFADVTDLKDAQNAMQASEERLQLALKGSNDAPWDTDLVNNSAYYSPRWWDMLGYGVDALPPERGLWSRLMHPDDRAQIEPALAKAIAGSDEGFALEFRLHHKDGHFVPVMARAFILRDASGRAIRVSGTNTDLTERKRSEERIHHMAFYDALTDLPNRRLMAEQLRKTLQNLARTSGNGALLFIDLDNFKQLNDTLGHDVGDLLLQQVAARLKACARGDDIVARLGGDEFVIMTESLSTDPFESAMKAETLGLKVLDALNGAYSLGTRQYKGTASIGVTLLNKSSPGVEAMLKQADLAMYQAKSEGRNQVCFFDATMQAALEHRVAMQDELRDGLEQHQLELYYQPQVRLAGGVIGAEVLLRWNHPVRGMVAPNSFIPLAEETGQIIPIGRWVVQQACQKIAEWSSDPQLSQIVLAVNVSVHQFHSPDFVDVVLDALKATGANANRLKLELTESALAKNIDLIVQKMEKLRTHGVTFSLDDFGTGYSSLTYLNKLPLDQLKIDRSFVQDLLTNSNAATLVRVIITMAKELGLSIIAEGVESAAQRDFLNNAGCHDYQGYLYGRPLPVTEFELAFRKLLEEESLNVST